MPHKGQRHFIEAAALVVRKVPDARFVIAGEGELRPALERQIKEHRLEKHVLLAGFRPDVLSLHKAFDIFVMSSITEGLGTSLLDAMAAARPIVATDDRWHSRSRGGRRDRVPRGPARRRGDGRAIVQLLKDPDLRQRMGQAGLARARELFSAERMLKETLKVYQRVALHPHVEDDLGRLGARS